MKTLVKVVLGSFAIVFFIGALISLCLVAGIGWLVVEIVSLIGG